MNFPVTPIPSPPFTLPKTQISLFEKLFISFNLLPFHLLPQWIPFTSVPYIILVVSLSFVLSKCLNGSQNIWGTAKPWPLFLNMFYPLKSHPLAYIVEWRYFHFLQFFLIHLSLNGLRLSRNIKPYHLYLFLFISIFLLLSILLTRDSSTKLVRFTVEFTMSPMQSINRRMITFQSSFIQLVFSS